MERCPTAWEFTCNPSRPRSCHRAPATAQPAHDQRHSFRRHDHRLDDVRRPLHVDRADLLAFALKWDPQPFHVDDAAAGPGGITAPGAYMFALKMGLIHRMDPKFAVIASVGFEEVRFTNPIRAEDDVTLKIEFIESRESKSKPDRGLVTLRYTLLNQRDEVCMTHLDTILLRKRPSA